MNLRYRSIATELLNNGMLPNREKFRWKSSHFSVRPCLVQTAWHIILNPAIVLHTLHWKGRTMKNLLLPKVLRKVNSGSANLSYIHTTHWNFWHLDITRHQIDQINMTTFLHDIKWHVCTFCQIQPTLPRAWPVWHEEKHHLGPANTWDGTPCPDQCWYCHRRYSTPRSCSCYFGLTPQSEQHRHIEGRLLDNHRDSCLKVNEHHIIMFSWSVLFLHLLQDNTLVTLIWNSIQHSRISTGIHGKPLTLPWHCSVLVVQLVCGWILSEHLPIWWVLYWHRD